MASKTISERVKDYIEREIAPYSKKTREFIKPAIDQALTVLEVACPVGMFPTRHGLRLLYGPVMHGGRYAMVLANPNIGAYQTFTELPKFQASLSPETLKDLDELSPAAMWGAVSSYIEKEDAKLATLFAWYIAIKRGVLEQVQKACDAILHDHSVPCIFVCCRNEKHSDTVHKATGCILIVPIGQSIERQIAVIDLGEQTGEVNFR